MRKKLISIQTTSVHTRMVFFCCILIVHTNAFYNENLQEMLVDNESYLLGQIAVLFEQMCKILANFVFKLSTF